MSDPRLDKLREALTTPSRANWNRVLSLIGQLSPPTRRRASDDAMEECQRWPAAFKIVTLKQLQAHPWVQQAGATLQHRVLIRKRGPRTFALEAVARFQDLQSLELVFQGPADYYDYNHGIHLEGPSLPHLKNLTISGRMHHIRDIKHLERLESLEVLHIFNANFRYCEGLLTEQLQRLPRLKALELEAYHPSGYIDNVAFRWTAPPLPSLETIAVTTTWIKHGGYLDLSQCPQLKAIACGADIKHIRCPSHMPRLERLHLDYIPEGKDTDEPVRLDSEFRIEGMEECPGLRQITAPACETLSFLPPIPSLETLHVASCEAPISLQRFPRLREFGQQAGVCRLEHTEQCTALTTISCREASLRLASLSPLSALHSLAFCVDDDTAPEIGELAALLPLSSLSRLDIKNVQTPCSYPGAPEITEQMHTRDAVEEYFLRIALCTGQYAGDTSRFTTLQFHQLQSTRHLGRFTNLQELIIDWCGSLKQIEPFGALPTLQRVSISDCPNLTRIDGLAGLSHVESIELTRCDALVDIQVLDQLPRLIQLSYAGSTGVKEPDWSRFPALREVHKPSASDGGGHGMGRDATETLRFDRPGER